MTTSLSARAVWFTAPRRVEVCPEAVAAPRPQEVMVRTVASLVSAGTELKYYRGHVPAGTDVGLPTMVASARGFPIKFGYDCVGTVVQTGADAALREGQLVFARHPHQDLFTAPVQHNGRAIIVPLPDGMKPETAIFLNLCEVALNTLLDFAPAVGDIAVVFGQGIVGNLITQLARRTAGRLVVVDPIRARRELALALGADVAVSPEDALRAVADASGGRGADVIYEVSGAPPALQTAVQAAAREATIVVASFYGDRTVPLVLSPEFHTRRVRVVSTMVGGINPALQPRWDFARRTQTALALLPTLKTDRLLSRRVAMVDAAEAFDALDRNPDDNLGIILTY